MAAVLGFLGLLLVLAIGVVTAIDGPTSDRDDVPSGVTDMAVVATRTDEVLTLVVPGDPAGSTLVSVCPGLVPGPSDAAGMRERVRVSGCAVATREPTVGADSWTLAFSALDAEQTVTFDTAERWLVVVTDPEASSGAGTGIGIGGSWITGGPLLPSGPLLP